LALALLRQLMLQTQEYLGQIQLFLQLLPQAVAVVLVVQ
jgi:hypothetical protein